MQKSPDSGEMVGNGDFRVIWILGLYGDNGKENGNDMDYEDYIAKYIEII